MYPSATHTRFAHSLGVAHLAARWTDDLLLRSAREDGASYHFDSLEVQLAGAAGMRGGGAPYH